MTRKAQIPLSFPVRTSYDVHDFLPLPCNQEAVDWVMRFPDWPYPVLVIYGQKGCGKTHLLHLAKDIATNKGEGDRLLVMDDIDSALKTPEDETELFHLINQAKSDLTYIILSMLNNVAQMDIQLPDLRSRLMAAPQIEMHAPDDMAIQALLVKLFHDRQLKIAPDVVAYILPRIERSYDAIHSLVAKIDEISMAQKRSVTIPLVRDLL